MSDPLSNATTPVPADWIPAIVPSAEPRVSISDAMRARVDTELRALPANRKGAVLVIGDDRETRAMFAARYGTSWKVAAGAGWVYTEKRPKGYLAVEFCF